MHDIYEAVDRADVVYDEWASTRYGGEVVFILNMQIAYLTPLLGFNLFYLRGIAPKGITMGDICRSIIPFTIIQALGLILTMVFPVLILWLPSTMIINKNTSTAEQVSC